MHGQMFLYVQTEFKLTLELSSLFGWQNIVNRRVVQQMSFHYKKPFANGFKKLIHLKSTIQFYCFSYSEKAYLNGSSLHLFKSSLSTPIFYHQSAITSGVDFIEFQKR
jgi:hypothetical protein